MKLVHLWEFESELFAGFLYPCNSGVQWSNQVGGTSCGHPIIEGIFVPLPPVMSKRGVRDPLEDEYISHPMYEYGHKKLVDQFLDVHKLTDWFEPLTSWHEVPGSQRLVAEAWVPVRVKHVQQYAEMGTVLRPFSGEAVILTYANSD